MPGLPASNFPTAVDATFVTPTSFRSTPFSIPRLRPVEDLSNRSHVEHLYHGFHKSSVYLSTIMDQTCYWPDATIVDHNYIPCTNTTTTGTYTPCCIVGDYCFSNGLCLGTGSMTTYRGSCTDRSWASPDCPQYCLELCAGSGCGVWPCDGNGHFGCVKEDCGTEQQIVVPAGTILLNAALSSAIAITQTSATTSSSEATPTHSTTSSSTRSTPSVSASAIGSIDAQSCHSPGTLAGVGIGIGVPLSIALLVVLVLLYQEKRRVLACTWHAGGSESISKETGTNNDGPKWMQTSSNHIPGLHEQLHETNEPVRELEGSQITST
jgi:hypothetical protein